MNQIRAGFSHIPLSTPSELIDWPRAKNRACLGSNDDLMIQCLVIEDPDCQIAMLVFDLLAIDFPECARIRSKVASLGIKPENVLIASTHTHAGPPTINFGSARKSERLIDELNQKVEFIVRRSMNSVEPASIQVGFTSFPDNVNRRERTWYGLMKTGVNLKGPVDHQVSFLQLTNSSHQRIIVLFYGCHPTIDRDIPYASADYVAGIREHAKLSGFDAAFFLNGALGDVNPYDRNEGHSLDCAGTAAANRFGGRMMNQILHAVHNESVEGAQGVHSACSYLDVSLPTFRDEPIHHKLMVQTFEIGELALAAFPGEIFAQTGLNLKSTLSTNKVAVISCANGYIGYVPPSNEYARGGYEVNGAPLRFGYKVPIGVAERFQRQVESLILARKS